MRIKSSINQKQKKKKRTVKLSNRGRRRCVSFPPYTLNTMATAQPLHNGTAGNLLSPDNVSAAQPPADTETDTTAAAPPPERRWLGWPGDCVFRLIVPVGKVGSIIGRKGELIKKMCEETRSRIRVLDAPLGTPDRIVSLNGT